MSINLIASIVTGKREVIDIRDPDKNERWVSFLRAEFNLDSIEDFIKVSERLFLMDFTLSEFMSNECVRESVRVPALFEVAEEFGTKVEEIDRPGSEGLLIGGFGDDAAILFGGSIFPQDKNTYLALFGESTSRNYQWRGHDMVVEAIKDGSVVREAENLGIG